MAEIFITSDTHFAHFNCATLWRGFKSIEEHDSTIVENWNAIVAKKDVVWHLGDVLMRGDGFDILPQLNGIKHLVLGNHEKENVHRYFPYFHKIVSTKVLKDMFVLSHAPLHEFNLVYKWKRPNVHGHLHKTAEHFKDLGNNYINMNTELHGYEPVHIDMVASLLHVKQCD